MHVIVNGRISHNTKIDISSYAYRHLSLGPSEKDIDRSESFLEGMDTIKMLTGAIVTEVEKRIKEKHGAFESMSIEYIMNKVLSNIRNLDCTLHECLNIIENSEELFDDREDDPSGIESPT